MRSRRRRQGILKVVRELVEHLDIRHDEIRRRNGKVDLVLCLPIWRTPRSFPRGRLLEK